MLNFEETRLTLGLPGTKRGFSEAIDLNSETSVVEKPSDNKPPQAKAQVVGWPPVRASRRNIATAKSCKYVKVALDGAPYLRKVDLETHGGYDQLLIALQDMFAGCLTICKRLDTSETKLVDPANGVEYLPTYEDKDGDWMLVGDVPWKMFVESCKRVRLMKSTEAIGLSSKETAKM